MKVNSKFNLFMQTDLSASDFKVLALLYQPLLGLNAYSIYNIFYQFNKLNQQTPHHFLLDLLNIKQDDFINAREKLEALGLLETYLKTEDEYLYILKAPFTAKQFLLDTFLGTYLESEIGERNFNTLIEVFKVNKPVVTHLDNITKDFDQLFQFHATSLLNIDAEFEGRNGVNSNLIKNSINYEDFVEKLPRALKGVNLLNENFKQKIIQLAFVYQFDVNQMVDVYTNAHKGRKNITIEQISLQAKRYYETNNKDLVVTNKVLNEQDALSNVPFTSIVDKFVVDDSFQKAMALDTIHDFINQNDIEVGVLNVLLIFILKNKNGILPHVNYLNKVWQSWAKNGVQSVGDALSYRDTIEKNWSNRQSSNNSYAKKEVKKPDWLDEYMKEISEMEG
ncbi:MAG TPA: DnaD domain protein [Haploplasma sp.]|nr:DnaD domain protein [Haploplasma sp.]